MMPQLCTMAMVHCKNAVWVPMSIIHPENWLPAVENSRLFAQRADSARCTPKGSSCKTKLLMWHWLQEAFCMPYLRSPSMGIMQPALFNLMAWFWGTKNLLFLCPKLLQRVYDGHHCGAITKFMCAGG